MRLNKKIMVAAAIACFGMVQSASAFDFEHAYKQCGLGGIVGNALNEDTGLVAIIVNITFDAGSTALTSEATDSCSDKSGKMASLVNDAYVPLEQDLAQGQGEYLDAMLATAGCDDVVAPSVVSQARVDFAAQVSAPGYASKTQFQKSEAMFNVFQASTAQCGSNS